MPDTNPEEKEDLRRFDYAETEARVEIREAYARLVGLLVRRAEEHGRRGFRDRAHRILGHAQSLSARAELVQMDWADFDKADREAGREPY